MAARSFSFLFTIVLLGASAGCSGSELADPGALPVQVSSAAAVANPHNALSALIAFTPVQAESARVMSLDQGGVPDSTPYVAVTEESDTIAVLGLLPASSYRYVVELRGAAGIARSDTLEFTTGALPDLLQRVSLSVAGTAGPGFILTSVQVGGTDVFALAFDSLGRIRWYRGFAGTERVGGELKQQPKGHFTLYRGGSTGLQKTPGSFVEFTPSGDSVRSITVSPPRYLDNHELWVTAGPDGQERSHFFTYDHRLTDLGPIGGAREVSLAGHQVVRLRTDGSTEFEWNAWDHLTLADWIEPPRPGAANTGELDFDHPNSLTFDPDGNYIISFRHLGQVMKIDGQTGAVIWRLGGRSGQFTFVGDPLGGFSAQHSAHVLPNGHVLLYDNGARHQPPESRAVEYALDASARTATLVWEFRHVPAIYTPGVGLVQRLANGNTFIAFAQIGRAVEVDDAGHVIWEGDLKVDGTAAFVYRLVRIASLYRFQEP